LYRSSTVVNTNLLLTDVINSWSTLHRANTTAHGANQDNVTRFLRILLNINNL